MKTSKENQMRYFVSYNDALKREKELGRVITLFDNKLAKIKERKDGKYIIEPILRLYGTDKDPKSYDNTLISQKGFLALELDEKEKQIFLPYQIMTFEKKKEDRFNIYQCTKQRRKEYALLDYDFKPETEEKNYQLVKLIPNLDEQGSYSISISEDKSQERLYLENEYLKQRSLDGHYYYYLKNGPFNIDVEEHTTYVERTEDNKYIITKKTYYLLPFININSMSSELQKEYWLLAKDAVKVGINMHSNQGINLEMYNQINNKKFSEGEYQFFFLLNPYTVTKGTSKEINDMIIKIQKNVRGYECIPRLKNDKTLQKKL